LIFTWNKVLFEEFGVFRVSGRLDGLFAIRAEFSSFLSPLFQARVTYQMKARSKLNLCNLWIL